ncbi:MULTISPECIES: AAA family ATPase [unclassified Mesorhizobium]|uniref:ParA family protein n=1 Tax=unclassified Mesorhizobium TaxID=325217 RepID=UPI000BAF432C|nr:MULTISPECIES: AAA family ATPase [unclassified Mesorhizobium]PBC22308.1 cobyrinic acid a,c-diamide synthase [Mesorhizobium sp. WSM4311]TRD07835.1 ParA family protein [Mesorhizobium sp. WSM4305]
MKIVSVINYKGGVGKTTVTANIAAELAMRGKKILIIDLDPQTNLTFSFIRPADWEKNFAERRTIKESFDSLLEGKNFDITKLIYAPSRVKVALAGRGNIDIICSHLGLINVDLELATLLGGANMRQSKQNFIRVHRRLADGLAEMEDDAYDVVLIDCPPNFNIVTKTAIVASDYILVPTRPDYLSTLGIDYLIRNVASLVADYNDYAKEGPAVTEEIQPATIGIVFNMIQERSEAPISAQQTYMQQVRRQSGLTVFTSYIKRNDTLFASAPESGVPVVLQSHSGGTYRSVVEGLEEVTTEFAGSIGLV